MGSYAGSAGRPVALNYPEISEQYIARVLDGSELVCRRVRLTIERHVRDLEHGAERGLSFDPEAGAKVCKFFSRLQPSKWPTPLELQPWQVCGMMILYGWKRADGTRRFRTAFWQLPRKTGKSALASGCGLYALVADGERGAEVYSMALTRDQARRVFDEAVAMRDGTKALREIIGKAGQQPCNSLHVASTASVMRPLSRDKDAVEGLNCSFGAADELHKWRGRDMWDVIRYSMRSRLQPMMFGTTTVTSVEDNDSICNMFDHYSTKVLEGILVDDAFFCWTTELDGEIKDAEGNVIQEADRWDDESKWIKANPNLGVTVKLEDMRQEALEARNQPSSLQAFKRYSLNVRVGAADQAIRTEDWDACARPGDPQVLRTLSLFELLKRPCFAALDLALTTDTSSLVLVFPPLQIDEKWRLIPHFWIPEANIKERCERDRVPYDLWQEQGFLVTTPGNTTDFEWIAARIMEISKLYDLREMIYDPALASGLIKLLLTSGFNKDKVVKFAQTAMNYAAPCGDFKRTVLRREIQHDADPVLRWQVSNLRWRKNHTGLIMPDKEKSVERIDGAVASIMGYGRATNPDNAKLFAPKPKLSVL